jgi:hypothetical protein
MNALRMAGLGLLVAGALGGCSRPQPTPAADPTPSTAPVPETSAAPASPTTTETSKATESKVALTNPPTTVAPPRQRDDNRVKARSLMFVLGYMADKYRKEHGAFPQTLESLVDSPEARIDPWGRRFHYDPKGPHNKGDLPDIWSEGADPSNPQAALTNWEDGSD